MHSYLESKGIEMWPVPNMNIRTSCFFHEDDHEAKDGKLYIKIDPDAEIPGLFVCFVCGEKGSLNKIKHHFGDPVDSESARKAKSIPIQDAAAEYYHRALVGTEEGGSDPVALDYLLQKRGLSLETVKKFKLGIATGDLMNHLLLRGFHKENIEYTGLVWDSGKDFFEKGTITIPYFDQGNCVQIRGRVDNDRAKYKTPPRQPKLLYNTDVLLESDEIFLTEGELDALVLQELGFHAVSVPGANQFTNEWAAFFQETRKVYVIFDNDRSKVGLDGAQKAATALGARARVVELPRHEAAVKVDVSQFIVDQGHTREDILELLKRSSSSVLVGVADAFEKWLQREGNPDLSGFSSGLARLDEVIKPGFLRGQVAIWLARTGTGKSVTMINLMQRMIKSNPELKVLFISLEQTSNEWFDRARRIHGFYNTYLNYDEINLETIEFYKRNLMIVDKNKLNIDELRSCVWQAEDELGSKIDMVIVDYLGYWARAFKGTPYERTSDAVMALKEVAKDTDVFIQSPHQVNRGSKAGSSIEVSDARDAGTVEETADFLFSIGSEDYDPGQTVANQSGLTTIKILKSRHGGRNIEIQTQFCPISLVHVPLVDNLYGPEFLERALKEREIYKKGEHDFEDIFRRHAEGDYSTLVYSSSRIGYSLPPALPPNSGFRP